MQKFRGSIEELKSMVASSGILGEWHSDGSKKTFRSLDRGILNWWERTRTIQFQGKSIARTALEQAFKIAMEKHTVKPTRGVKEEDDYYDDDFDDDIGLIDDDCDDPVHISSIPVAGGDLLLNLVKDALVEYGFAISPRGQSTFLFKGTAGTPLFTLAQNGPMICIWTQ